MRKISILFFLLPYLLLSQQVGDFSVTFDGSDRGLDNIARWVVKDNQDTLYISGFYVDAPWGYGYMAKVTPDAEIIKIIDVDAIQTDRSNMLMYNDTIYILDSPGEDSLSRYRVTLINRNLEIISVHEYDLGYFVEFLSDQDFQITEDRIIITGYKREPLEGPNWLTGVICILNRYTMKMETIIDTLFDGFENTQYYESFFKDETLYVFFRHKQAIEPGAIAINRGVAHFLSEDDYDINILEPIERTIGNEQYFADSNFFYNYTAEIFSNVFLQPGSLTKLNFFGDTLWKIVDWPGGSGYPSISDYTLTQNKDVVLYGLRTWYHNYDGVTFPPPDGVILFDAAYAAKFNGETGEKEWGYIYYTFDEYDNVLVQWFEGMVELSDGDLVGVGGIRYRDSLGNSLNRNSWILRMPGDGCYLGDCEGIESFLTSTEEIKFESGEKAFHIFPNPANDFLNIEYIGQHHLSDLKYQLTSIDGKIISNSRLTLHNASHIDISGLANGMYILNIIDEKNRDIHAIKFVKK